ncbi:MAG: YhjD/YihY/BrkB family envelope integrity protein [Anaerohalosphaeraceae bacterium]
MNEQASQSQGGPRGMRKWLGWLSFWSADSGGEKSKIVLFLHILRQCVRLLVLNRCSTQAAALAYHTIFGVIPLAIVMLMVFQMFPAYKNMGDKVKQLVYEQLNLHKIVYAAEHKTETDQNQTVPEGTAQSSSVSISAKIDEITANYITNLNTGAITFVSGLLTFWAAIGLLTTIEKSFNTIWGVPRSRDFLHRVINYWTMLTLGPLLLGAGVYLSTRFAFSQSLQEGIFTFIKPVFSFGLSVLLIFCLYVFIPNARVKPLWAGLGAVIAAILWTAAKIGFGIYVAKASYQSVYGILGLIPLAVFWIYIIWLIVLLGLQLTYAAQHVHSLDRAEKLAELRSKQASFVATEQAVIQIMQEVLVAFEDKNRKPIMASEIADVTTLQADFIEPILENMTRAGLLCKTTDPIVGYVPSTDGGHITLADISLAVEQSSFKTQNPKLQEVLTLLRAELSKHNLKDIL